LFIDVIIASPKVATHKFGLTGALPNTPFLHYIFPFKNFTKTTYFEQAQTT